MKRILSVAAAASFALSAPAVAESPQQIAELSRSGTAQFECSVLSNLAEKPNETTEKHFNAALGDFRKFLTKARTADPHEMKVAIDKTTPLIVTFAIGGPTDDFDIGRIYSDILQSVDDELRDRETWTHHKKDPNESIVSNTMVRMRADDRYREKNCDLLK